jgi:serine protease AprX
VHFNFVDFTAAIRRPWAGTRRGIIARQRIRFERRAALRSSESGRLKVPDGDGFRYISNVIAALDYLVEHRTQYNIRVINLSVAAGVYESYTSDPLTLAARRAVEAGIVVVTAAGNLGRNAQGQPQYGGITARQCALRQTVGASSKRHDERADDSIALFSSRGRASSTAREPIAVPGVGIESLG